ncbi:hypothetical protein F443_22636, partial [Phytophthora nicotianae P1569]
MAAIAQPEYFPDVEVLDENIFNDHFWETLVANCPLINHVELWEIANDLDFPRLHAFTDRGLVPLAKLKCLHFMSLRRINFTGNGIFEFRNGFSNRHPFLRPTQKSETSLLQPTEPTYAHLAPSSAHTVP